MLARLLRISLVALFACAAAWAVWWWPLSVVTACVGAALTVLGYAAVMALEFFLLAAVNHRDPAPRARVSALVRAWWGEVVAAAVVFGWRQPFRPSVQPDHLPRNGRRGVLFIHGFVCNRGFWTPWLRRLRARDQAFVALSLEPVFGSIDDYVPLIEAAVQQLHAATGQAPVLVCHSMGGLAARAWLRTARQEGRVHRILTIGTPHHGTWLGQFSHVSNGRQMRLDSRWLQQLQKDETPERRALFTCWYSNCDNIVFPASTAMLQGADNRFVTGLAHVQMAFDPALVEAGLALCE